MPEYTNHSNPIGARLKLEMKKRGLTSSELARRSDVLTSFLYDIISGKSSNPSTIKLAKVADTLGVSLAYLVRGIDETQPSISALKDGYVAIPRLTLNSNTDGNHIQTGHIEGKEPFYFSSDFIRSHIGADILTLRVFSINGDNMEPTLLYHDIVLVDISQKTPSPPSIFILFDGAGMAAKRLEYVSNPKNQHIRVISDNPHYSTYECSISDAAIIGRVVWFSREI